MKEISSSRHFFYETRRSHYQNCVRLFSKRMKFEREIVIYVYVNITGRYEIPKYNDTIINIYDNMQIICPISRMHYRLYGVLLFISLQKARYLCLVVGVKINICTQCVTFIFKG